MPLAGFEPTIPTIEGPQNYAQDHTVIGIGFISPYIQSKHLRARVHACITNYVS
jgi:hypothetical protein